MRAGGHAAGERLCGEQVCSGGWTMSGGWIGRWFQSWTNSINGDLWDLLVVRESRYVGRGLRTITGWLPAPCDVYLICISPLSRSEATSTPAPLIEVVPLAESEIFHPSVSEGTDPAFIPSAFPSIPPQFQCKNVFICPTSFTYKKKLFQAHCPKSAL